MATRRVGTSPFQCGADVCFIAEQPHHNELTIRAESAGSFKIAIKIWPENHASITPADPSSTNADFFLDSGDSITIKKLRIKDLSQVRFINITGDAEIFWSAR